MKIIISMKITFVLSVFVGLAFLQACVNKNSSPNVNSLLLSRDSIALDSLNKLIGENEFSDALYAQRAGLYTEMGKLTKALNDYLQASKIDSTNVNYLIELSDRYLQFGKSGKTREYLLRAKELDAENVHVLYRLANLHFYVKEYKKSISYLNTAKDIDPFFAPIYFTKGLIYKENLDTIKAIAQFQIAVEREPSYYDAYIQLGTLWGLMNNTLAIDYYKNALAILPESYEAAYGLAMSYQLFDKPEKAIDQYNKMLIGNRDKFQHVYFNLGYIEMIFFNEYTTAISYFDSAIYIQSNYAEAYSNKAYCLEQLNNNVAATECYKKALDITPGMPIAESGLQRMNNYKNR